MYFNSAFFRGNREQLRSAANSELIIITANGLMQRSGDTTYPFRQDSNFWYLTGINDPDVVLVMDGSNEYLIMPNRDPLRELFDGQLDAAAYAKTSGINETLALNGGRQRLFNRLKKTRRAATLFPAAGYIGFHGFYTNPARARLLRQMKGVCAKLEIEDLRSEMANMRMRKQKPEINAIQSAIDITLLTLNDISSKSFQGFEYEYQLEAAVTEGFRKRGATGHAFAPIIASGKHACQIHHVENNGKISENTQLLFDVGAEVSNYSADITRTYFVGKPGKRYQSVHNVVANVYAYARDQLKPGVIIRDYEKLVEKFMGKRLQELGLITVQDRQSIRHYYPHATSHFLGLDTHDAGDYSQPLEPNMVLTVEPGIYIPEEGIGVRIEDDVLITKNGNKVLSGKV